MPQKGMKSKKLKKELSLNKRKQRQQPRLHKQNMYFKRAKTIINNKKATSKAKKIKCKTKQK